MTRNCLQDFVCFSDGLSSSEQSALQPKQKGSTPRGVRPGCCSLWEKLLSDLFSCTIMLGSSSAFVSSRAVLQDHLISAVLVGLGLQKRLGVSEVLLASLPCFMWSLFSLEMEYEASLPEKKSNTLSRDLIDYVRYMIQSHGENYKVSTGCARSRGTQSWISCRMGITNPLPRILV